MATLTANVTAERNAPVYSYTDFDAAPLTVTLAPGEQKTLTWTGFTNTGNQSLIVKAESTAVSPTGVLTTTDAKIAPVNGAPAGQATITAGQGAVCTVNVTNPVAIGTESATATVTVTTSVTDTNGSTLSGQANAATTLIGIKNGTSEIA